MPQGVPRCGHAAVCTWGILGKAAATSSISNRQKQNTLLQEEYLPRGRFLPKGHPPVSLPSLHKADMLTYRQKGTAQALMPLCILNTSKTPAALRHGDWTRVFILMPHVPPWGRLDPLPLRWSQPEFNISYPPQLSGCCGFYFFCIYTSLFLCNCTFSFLIFFFPKTLT